MALNGKVILVTGAAQGIGRGIALRLAKEGADIALVDLKADKLSDVAKEIEALGIPALNRILVDTVERFQGSERDVIIYSCCINSYYQLKFVSNLTEENGVLIDRKLNVALTRARKQMFVTGVPKYLKSNPLYESLLNLIETQG